jgi:hypothetical protein
MSENVERDDTALILVLVLFVMVIPATLYGGWVLQTLWGWFVVPTFHFAPLTIWTAIGLRLILTLTTHQMRETKPENTKGVARVFGECISAAFAWPSLLLFIGWMVKP